MPPNPEDIVDHVLDDAPPSPKRDRGAGHEEDMGIFNACIRMAEIGFGRWDARRSYEWKITIGLWTLLAAAIYRGFEILPLLVGLLVVVGHGWWLRNIWVRHASDANLAWHFFNQGQRFLAKYGVESLPERTDIRIGRGRDRPGGSIRAFLSDWAMGFQFAVTVGLIAVLYLAGTNEISWGLDMVLKTPRGS